MSLKSIFDFYAQVDSETIIDQYNWTLLFMIFIML